MCGSNSRTLRSYDDRIQNYIEGTSQEVSGAARDWINAAVMDLPLEAKLIELGSAFGRDAAYIEAKGFQVECTDAAEGFVAHLQAKGFKARLFNALTDHLTQNYDLIFANAVLLHFNRQEFLLVARKMLAALNRGGRFAFSLKRGTGEAWSTAKIGAPRYFCYWQSEDIEKALADAGFARWTIDEVTTQRAHSEWIFVIANAS